MNIRKRHLGKIIMTLFPFRRLNSLAMHKYSEKICNRCILSDIASEEQYREQKQEKSKELKMNTTKNP